MNKSTFEHEYGRSCFMDDENTDDLRDIIKRYRNKVINLYFKNKKFAWDSSTIKDLKDDIKKILIERQKMDMADQPVHIVGKQYNTMVQQVKLIIFYIKANI